MTTYAILDVDVSSDDDDDGRITPPPLPPPPALRPKVDASDTIYVDAEDPFRREHHATIPDFGLSKREIVYERLPDLSDNSRFEPLMAPPEAELDDALPSDVRVSTSQTLPGLVFLSSLLFFFGEHGRGVAVASGVRVLLNFQFRASLIAVNMLMLALGLQLAQLHTSDDVRRRDARRRVWLLALTRYGPLYVTGFVLGLATFFAVPFGTGNVFEALFAAVLSLVGLQAFVPWFVMFIPSLWLCSVVAFMLTCAPRLLHVARKVQTQRSRVLLGGVILLCLSLSLAPTVIYWLVAGGASTSVWFGKSVDLVFVGLRAFPLLNLPTVFAGTLLSQAVDWLRHSTSPFWHVAAFCASACIGVSGLLVPPADETVFPRTSGYDVLFIFGWGSLLALHLSLIGAHKGALSLVLRTNLAQRAGRLAPAIFVLTPIASYPAVITRFSAVEANVFVAFSAMLVTVLVLAIVWTEFVSQNVTARLRRRFAVTRRAAAVGEQTSLLGKK